MLKDLILRAENIIKQPNPTDQALVDVENALSAYLEAIATDRISDQVGLTDLEHANRLLREVRRERSRRLAELQQLQQAQTPSKTFEDNLPGHEEQVNISPQLGEDDTYDPLRKFRSSSHDPEAENIMNTAEEAFYAGDYKKSIALFEKVLQLEPGWSRAEEHRAEAEEFLRTGNIPSVALPPEAGKAFGKAQSAARVFRYQTALDYLDDAFTSLNETGINRWREGEELRQDLENQMQAHEVYQEGLARLRQGDLDAGLSKIQTAASAAALPEYVDKASEIRNDLAALDEIADVVNLSGNIPPDKLADSRTKLDRLSVKYGEIPQISRLRNRMDLILPTVTSTLIEKVQRLIRQGESASTLAAAQAAYSDAEDSLTTLRTLRPDHAQGQTLLATIQDSQQAVADLEDNLQRANQALNTENKFYPKNAFKISKPVRTRFPQDPQVLDLKRSLRWYPITRYGGGALAGILVIFLMWFGGRGIAGVVSERQLAQTPSPTATATITPTSTVTVTPTITPTPTPEPTETPDYTPTATPVITGTVTRTLFIRSYCYDTHVAVGRVPEGSVVRLISMPERLFDYLNRECFLVEYRTEDTVYTGYILAIDLAIP
jgi:tetratricopeptide (TPR) repeat protein